MHNDCPVERNFAPFKSCPGGMVLDEVDTCIIKNSTEVCA